MEDEELGLITEVVSDGGGGGGDGDADGASISVRTSSAGVTDGGTSWCCT